MSKTKLLFNPFAKEFRKNPYPIYTKLREEDPIHWSPFQAWIITRYDDIENILTNPSFQVDDLPARLDEKSAYMKDVDFSPLAKTIDKWLLFLKVPDHTRLRGLVSKVFSPGSVESMRPLIEANVNNLLDKVKPTGKIDLIKDLSTPLPAIIITHILGLPPEDFTKLIRWSHHLFFIVEQPAPLEDYHKQNEIAKEARDYLLDFMARQHLNDNEGLISQLLRVKNKDGRLSEDEILSLCIMLIIGGQESSKSFIGNAILALLQHPEKLKELKNNPEIIKEATDELLRYDTPVQLIPRLADEDVQMRGKTIRKGDKLILCVGAANRDPAKFTDPDTINFQRHNHNLPFGGGIHYCLGAFLARLEGQIAINTIIRDLPNLQLATDILDWRKNLTLRGLESLPLTFDK